MTTTILDPTTQRATTDEFMVADVPVTVVVVVGEYGGSGRFVLQIKGGDNFVDVLDPELIVLGAGRMAVVISARGTFRWRKDESAEALGMEVSL